MQVLCRSAMQVSQIQTVLYKLKLQTIKMIKRLPLLVTTITALLVSGVSRAEYALNFQPPVTQTARDIYGLHMTIFIVCVVIFVAVFTVMFYSIYAHRKSKNFTPSTFSHSTSVEIVWTIVPFLILVGMAVPATIVLIKMEDTTKSDLTIKITGYQWKWGYEYLGTDIDFYSSLSTPREQIDQFDKASAQELGDNYLLETDNHLVVPSGRKVRALITANDVIHAWWIPAFGVKKDAIPGYINELWFNVDEGKEGIYRGQCAELCGKDHAYMPIVVEVVTGEKFDNWVASGGTSFDTNTLVEVQDESLLNETVESALPAAEATTIGVDESKLEGDLESQIDESVVVEEWTKDRLMSHGEDIYKQCIACHGSDGKGIPGVFPAIAGSAIVNGDVDAQIELVMFGKANTAMVAFANQLSDEDIASVITYQRNSFGNSVGDIVLPADVEAKR